jgi:hypothetical protein
MASLSFIHCADVHLGAPVRGSARMPRGLRDRLRDAPADAFAKIVSEAVHREVDAVIIAGDLFDAEDRNLRAHVRLRSELARLDDADIACFVACGNHDPLGGLSGGVTLPDAVQIFGPRVESFPILRDGAEIARVFGVSYEKKAVRRNLANEFPRRPDGPFNIAVLHANVGDREPHGRYSPCKLRHLTDAGFDYWALGHVHTRETLHSKDPVVHYPGNPQALHTREPGARGATLVQVSDSGAVEVEPLWTDVVRWHRHRTAIDDMATIDDLTADFDQIVGNIRLAAPNRLNIVRWTLFGSGPLHPLLNAPGAEADLRGALRSEHGVREMGNPVWLERIDVATHPTHDVDRLRQQPDYLGDMLGLADGLAAWRPRSPRAEVGDARPPIEDPPAGAAVRGTLASLLDEPRLVRALGDESVWDVLRFDELLNRAEARAVECLAPAEIDT